MEEKNYLNYEGLQRFLEQLETEFGITFDDRPTEGSKNPVTSEGIKAAIDEAIGFAVDEILSTGY